MPARDELREFLRGRRDRLVPSDAGLSDDRRRRVPGLRREEVARLAGVSVDYYSRLEQGRQIAVPSDVLSAIADALQLTGSDQQRLFELAQPARHRSKVLSARPRVRAGVLAMIDSLTAPALVVGPGLDVLASNRLARALLADFEELPWERCNLARWVLLDPVARQRYVEWEAVARDTVADLHDRYGRVRNDQRLDGLVAELEAACPEFHAWWGERHQLERLPGARAYAHPRAGSFTLRHEEFVIAGCDHQVLLVDIAEPRSCSDHALQRLTEEHAR